MSQEAAPTSSALVVSGAKKHASPTKIIRADGYIGDISKAETSAEQVPTMHGGLRVRSFIPGCSVWNIRPARRPPHKERRRQSPLLHTQPQRRDAEDRREAQRKGTLCESLRIFASLRYHLLFPWFSGLHGAVEALAGRREQVPEFDQARGRRYRLVSLLARRFAVCICLSNAKCANNPLWPLLPSQSKCNRPLHPGSPRWPRAVHHPRLWTRPRPRVGFCHFSTNL